MSSRLLTAAAALALLATRSASAASYYWEWPGRDAPYQDYAQYGNLTIPQLEALCDSQAPKCLGFNAGGFLKNNLSAFQPAATTLYTRETTPQPPPPRVFVWPLPRELTLPGDGAPEAMARTALLAYIATAVWAWWMDRHPAPGRRVV